MIDRSRPAARIAPILLAACWPSLGAPEAEPRYTIETIAGNGGPVVGNGKRGLPEEGGLAGDQPFITPQGLALRDGKLWIASPSGHGLWRFYVGSGRIHRAAARGKARTHGRRRRSARGDIRRAARCLADHREGVLCIAEGENNVIRALDTGRRTIRTIAGAGPKEHRYTGDGVPAVQAPIWQPHGVLEIEDGQVLISDTMNHRVRLLKPVSSGP